jgi:hypothetical protein
MQTFPVKGQRPLKDHKIPQIKALAHQSVKWKNHGVAMMCAEEASHHKTKSLKSVLEILQALEIPPAAWLKTAHAGALKIERPAPGSHYVYVILLFDPDRAKDPFGLYVGESANPPDVRFGQHRRGYKASKAVKKYGISLLPSLFEHINPFSKGQNLEVQAELAEVFRIAGFWLEGGH